MLYYYGIMRAGCGAGVGCILAVVFFSAIFKQLMQGVTNGHHFLDAVCFPVTNGHHYLDAVLLP